MIFKNYRKLYKGLEDEYKKLLDRLYDQIALNNKAEETIKRLSKHIMDQATYKTDVIESLSQELSVLKIKYTELEIKYSALNDSYKKICNSKGGLVTENKRLKGQAIELKEALEKIENKIRGKILLEKLPADKAKGNQKIKAQSRGLSNATKKQLKEMSEAKS